MKTEKKISVDISLITDGYTRYLMLY